LGNKITLNPKIVSVRLKSFDERLHADFDHIWAASALSGSFAVLDPPRGRKIRRLCAIESMVEASVITVRKGYHKFTGFLNDLVVRDRIIFQYHWRNH
jgi:hypothetical protein